MKLEKVVKALVRVRVHFRPYILIIDDNAYWQYGEVLPHQLSTNDAISDLII